MTKRTTLSLHLLVALFLAGSGYAVGRFTADPKVEVVSEKGETRTVSVKDATDAVALSKALSEIDALKAENERLKISIEEPQTLAAAQPEIVEEMPVRPPQTWRERMEELKEKDPERYEMEVQRRQNFINTMDQLRAERIGFLDSIDTSLLSPEAQETHSRFTSAIARQGELQREMMALMDAGEEPSDELRIQMHDTFREINQTRDAERAALLNAIATSMGLEGDAAGDFSTLVNEVIEATNGQIMRMGPMRGMRPRNGNR